MVKAILDGRKTQTRRPCKFQDADNYYINHSTGTWQCHTIFDDKLYQVKCPYAIGDRLWVRETWGIYSGGEDGDLIPGTIPSSSLVYRATDDMGDLKGWKPSLFMPRWASRITLEIVDVKVERLQDIRAWEDVLKEGIQLDWYEHDGNEIELIDEFHKYWDSLYTKKPEYQWQANPWVWVIEFRNILGNVPGNP